MKSHKNKSKNRTSHVLQKMHLSLESLPTPLVRLQASLFTGLAKKVFFGAKLL